ncbi:MAG: hypothetical protein KME17_07265 [Cyanosarcina radialis HA8281-LM2]|jgi:hypothetical protein|nr:hypothetical protein [Cyanosarcina radialis HA8281-LM2]
MGVIWTVFLLDEQMKDWLDEIGVGYPNAFSKFPTGREVKEVLPALSDFDVEVDDNGVGASWQASIVSKSGGDSGEWTVLNITEYSGDDKQQKIWFAKGSRNLIALILKELSNQVGPLVLIPDTGDNPLVISATT